MHSPPFIRIGTDSEDHTDFSHDAQYEEDIFPASTPVTPYPEATNITLGQRFYNLSQTGGCLTGTRVHWGVNLRQYNLTAVYLETKALVQAFESPAVKANGITLKFIEIGNEADLYHDNGGRNSSWSVFEYVPQWVQFATNFSELSETSFTELVGGAFTGSSHNNISGFSPQAIFSDGILDTLPGAFITTGSFCTGSGAVLQELMTKSYIRENITVFEPGINATFAHGLEYILGETNSMSCHGAPGVSNTAGAALWALDYSLFATTQIGISRLHFHEGVGYKYNFIQSVTLNYSILDGSPITPLPPHIQLPYYAAVIAAEAIGLSGSVQVVEIPINATDISIFEYGNLARAVFINNVAYLPGGGARNATHINFGTSYANATSEITWGGQTYETANARVSGPLQVETLDTSEGLNIQETEAVLLSFL